MSSFYMMAKIFFYELGQNDNNYNVRTMNFKTGNKLIYIFPESVS